MFSIFKNKNHWNHLYNVDLGCQLSTQQSETVVIKVFKLLYQQIIMMFTWNYAVFLTENYSFSFLPSGYPPTPTTPGSNPVNGGPPPEALSAAALVAAAATATATATATAVMGMQDQRQPAPQQMNMNVNMNMNNQYPQQHPPHPQHPGHHPQQVGPLFLLLWHWVSDMRNDSKKLTSFWI